MFCCSFFIVLSLFFVSLFGGGSLRDRELKPPFRKKPPPTKSPPYVSLGFAPLRESKKFNRNDLHLHKHCLQNTKSRKLKPIHEELLLSPHRLQFPALQEDSAFESFWVAPRPTESPILWRIPGTNPSSFRLYQLLYQTSGQSPAISASAASFCITTHLSQLISLPSKSRSLVLVLPQLEQGSFGK
jgi:hypothetical protein